MSGQSRCFPLIVHRVLRRVQKNVCAGCGCHLERMRSSVDHVIPASAGGPDRLGNLVLMHGRCNRPQTMRRAS